MLYAALAALVLAVVTSIILYTGLSTGAVGLGVLFPLFFVLYAAALLAGLSRSRRK